MTPSDVIKQRIALRDGLAAMQERFALECKPYQDAADVLDQYMLGYLNTQGLDNVKTQEGTAYKSTTTTVRMADRHEFMGYIIAGIMSCDTEEEAMRWTDYFTAAVAKEPIASYTEQFKCPPPGIDTAQIVKCNFRKPT